MKARCSLNGPSARRGAVVVLTALLMIVLVACVALAIDVGYMLMVRTELQASADAAALAGAATAGSQSQGIARSVAQQYAAQNAHGDKLVLKSEDVEFGVWDFANRKFYTGGASPNALRVTTRRSDAQGNSVKLFFAPVVGVSEVNSLASAVAIIPRGSAKFRFLLDDEFIDNDIASVVSLAKKHGKSPDDLISDKNGDGFVDIPKGSQLELPTGQVGDEGLFDRTSYEGKFPFKSGSPYGMKDFLAEGTALESELGTKNLQDVEWTSKNAPHKDFIGKKVLDPVPGCDPVSSHATIMSLPDPDQAYLSPLFKSDVSMAERDPSKYGSPTANLQGERRGLLAFKILSARKNPAGGSYLPLLTIEVLDPEDVSLDDVSSGSGGSAKSRLVN